MNFYGSLILANEYFDETDFTDVWSTFTDVNKIKALKRATVLIDALKYQGQKYSSTQELQFPRIVVYKSRRSILNVDSDGEIVVPERVEQAAFVQAKAMLENTNNMLAKAQKSGITSISVGGASESYDLSKTLFSSKDGLLIEAKTLLSPYLLQGV